MSGGGAGVTRKGVGQRSPSERRASGDGGRCWGSADGEGESETCGKEKDIDYRMAQQTANPQVETQCSLTLGGARPCGRRSSGRPTSSCWAAEAATGRSGKAMTRCPSAPPRSPSAWPCVSSPNDRAASPSSPYACQHPAHAPCPLSAASPRTSPCSCACSCASSPPPPPPAGPAGRAAAGWACADPSSCCGPLWWTCCRDKKGLSESMML